MGQQEKKMQDRKCVMTDDSLIHIDAICRRPRRHSRSIHRGIIYVIAVQVATCKSRSAPCMLPVDFVYYYLDREILVES